MRTFFVFVFILLSQSLLSQMVIPTTDYTSVGELDITYSKIRNFNALPEGQKKVENLSYADVLGSPFWDDNWNAAVFVLANGNIAKTQKAKLNLYTNEVHFVNAANMEMACENRQIRKIFFYKGMDTSKVTAVFESFAEAGDTKNIFYRVLNSGKLRLMEYKKVSIKEKEYNPLLGKKEYSFFSKTNYSLAIQEKIIPLKSLNPSGILSFIPDSNDYKDWIAQNNNKLKTESEIVSFFNYYNSKAK
jgi:hypothetical protein